MSKSIGTASRQPKRSPISRMGNTADATSFSRKPRSPGSSSTASSSNSTRPIAPKMLSSASVESPFAANGPRSSSQSSAVARNEISSSIGRMRAIVSATSCWSIAAAAEIRSGSRTRKVVTTPISNRPAIRK